MAMNFFDKVVVVTGASSGIGRATAIAFAERGATVILAARRQTALREVADHCIGAGGRAMSIPTDVTDETQVETLANRAIEAFGTIDIWVNNAGVMQFGRFEEIPPDVFEQVIRTNFFGTVYGARAVLPQFFKQGFGILINNASMAATSGHRYATAYSSAKFAVRGFCDALRQELLDEPEIHVCTVLPGSVDTPLFQHAANYTGRAVKPMGPIYPPEKVAATIVWLAENPRPEAFVGSLGKLADIQHALAPGLTERMMARAADRGLFQDHAAPRGPGNVLRPMAEHIGESGGWRESPGMPGNGRSGMALAGLALAALPLGYYAWRKMR